MSISSDCIHCVHFDKLVNHSLKKVGLQDADVIITFFISYAADLGSMEGHPQPTAHLWSNCTNFSLSSSSTFQCLSIILLLLAYLPLYFLLSFQNTPSAFFPYHCQCPQCLFSLAALSCLSPSFSLHKIPSWIAFQSCLLVFKSKWCSFYWLGQRGHEELPLGRDMLWMNCRTEDMPRIILGQKIWG